MLDEQSYDKRITDLEYMMRENTKQHEEILALLKPISETYSTVSNLGKWLSAFLVLVSIVIGIVLGFKELK